MTASVGELTFAMMTDSSRRISRIVETIEAVDSVTVLRTIDYEIDVGDLQGSLVLPLLYMRRDRLVSDQHVSSRDPYPCRVLTREESREHHAQILEALVQSETEQLDHAEQSRLRSIARSIVETPPAQAVQHARELGAALCRIDKESPAADEAALMAEYDYTLVHVWVDHRCTRLHLQLGYESPHAIRRSSAAHSVVDERLRNAFNHVPKRYQIRCPLMFAAASYHLRMLGPPEHFVRLQAFVQEDGNKGNKDRLRPVEPHPDEAEILGTPTRPVRGADLYAFKMRKPRGDARQYAAIEFMERPPGVTGPVLVSIALTWIAMLIMTIVLPTLAPRLQSIDVAALWVLLPTLLGAALLPGAQDWKVLQGPVRARATLAAAGLLSLGGATMLLLTVALSSASETDRISGHWRWPWVGLLVLQGALTLDCLHTLRRCRRSYREAVALDQRLRQADNSKDPPAHDRYTDEQRRWIADALDRIGF